jgi:hypothetical protein
MTTYRTNAADGPGPLSSDDRAEVTKLVRYAVETYAYATEHGMRSDYLQVSHQFAQRALALLEGR